MTSLMFNDRLLSYRKVESSKMRWNPTRLLYNWS